MRAAGILAVLALGCGSGTPRPTPPRADLAARYPLAALDDRTLCDRLLARSADDYRVAVDAAAKRRRKVIVSDLHLGPGADEREASPTGDDRFPGVEDFYAGTEWAAFLADQAALGPTDLIIAGDFIDFWQIAALRGDLPKRDDAVQTRGAPVLAADHAASKAALDLVLRAHPGVFRELGALIARGDHRVIILAGNHDADLLWPGVQLAIARAIDPVDPARLMFVDAAAYEHAGVHVAHGHAYDPANHFATGHAPFGRDRDGTCRLQSSWGEIFVDQFYTETERQIPFIDNLHPVSAGVLWALRDEPDPKRDIGAALRFIELIRIAESPALNRDAIGTVISTVVGTPGSGDRGPGSVGEVVDHLTDRLVDGDATAEAVTDAALRLVYDPELAGLWSALGKAGAALPDIKASLRALVAIDRDALAHLRDRAFGDTLDTAAEKIIESRPGIEVVVFGHTHDVGGLVHRLELDDGSTAHYANAGSWISVASVAELRAHGVSWGNLNIADRATFPSKTTAVVVEYDGDAPRAPVLRNAP